MAYTTKSGRWADTVPVELANALQLTGNANGDSLELGDRGVARLSLTVSAIGAGTTLTVYIETSADDTNWRAVSNYSGVNSAPSSSRLSFSGLDRFIRARYAFVGGTTTATVTLTGEAV